MANSALLMATVQKFHLSVVMYLHVSYTKVIYLSCQLVISHSHMKVWNIWLISMVKSIINQRLLAKCFRGNMHCHSSLFTHLRMATLSHLQYRTLAVNWETRLQESDLFASRGADFGTELACEICWLILYPVNMVWVCNLFSCLILFFFCFVLFDWLSIFLMSYFTGSLSSFRWAGLSSFAWADVCGLSSIESGCCGLCFSACFCSLNAHLCGCWLIRQTIFGCGIWRA